MLVTCIDISISRAGSIFLQWSGTVCENLVEGIMRNISLKFV